MSISNLMETDHDSMDNLFSQFQEKKETELKKARELFNRFRERIKSHIDLEEETLFSEFEEKMDMDPRMGPTQVMRQEHRLIQEQMAIIARGLSEEEPTAEAEEKLKRLLTDHNEKEEHVLYPKFDQLLPEDELSELQEKLSPPNQSPKVS